MKNKKLHPKDVVRRRIQHFEARQMMGDVILKAGIVVLLFYAVFFVLFGVATVPDEGMSPSLRQGDLTLYNRMDKSAGFTDVISYIDEGKTYFSRIMGLPGDVIDINEEGQYLVNGQPQAVNNEPIILLDRGSVAYPVSVPDDSVFLLNDNYGNTDDSRTKGPVSMKKLSGHLMMIMRRRSF